MDTRQLIKRAALAFAVVLAGYFAVFYWIEHRRVVNGPWRVEFTTRGTEAELRVHQTHLGISNVTLQFANVPAVTNVTEVMEFRHPRNTPYPLPLGVCVFQDLLFLPGTVVVEFGGHEIQLMPRSLTIDRVARPWRSGEIIKLNYRAAAPSP